MSESSKNTSDKHHCRCFRINPKDIAICKQCLEEKGFEDQLIGEQDHGQVFGLRRKLLELLQIHFKVMPTGIIESELEPPPEYHGAHLNNIHSYPPHDGIPILLDIIEIRYTVIQPTSKTCKLPTIINPDMPLKWWEMLIVGLAVAGIGILVIQALRK